MFCALWNTVGYRVNPGKSGDFPSPGWFSLHICVLCAQNLGQIWCRDPIFLERIYIYIYTRARARKHILPWVLYVYPTQYACILGGGTGTLYMGGTRGAERSDQIYLRCIYTRARARAVKYGWSGQTPVYPGYTQNRGISGYFWGHFTCIGMYGIAEIVQIMGSESPIMPYEHVIWYAHVATRHVPAIYPPTRTPQNGPKSAYLGVLDP